MTEHTEHGVPANEDTRLLAKLGYKQVLDRGFGRFGSFAISFTIISILAGCLTSYFLAFNSGGPAIVTWGWLLVSIMVTFVGLGLADVASAMPAAGSMYFWAAKLGGPVWGWFNGWINLAGVIAVTAAIDYGAALFWTALLDVWFGIGRSTGVVFIVYTVIVGLHFLINLNKVRIVGIMNNVSAVWHICGVLIMVLVLIFVPDYHRSADFVFTHLINTSFGGPASFANPWFWWAAAAGLLMAQYTITGFGASAHLAEETTIASRSAAIGIVSSIVVSGICGFILLVVITFAVPPDLEAVKSAGGFMVPYIWEHAVGGAWAALLLFIACVAQFFCGNASMASASRMLFAFSRDGAMPGGQKIWRKVSVRNHVPMNALWLIALLVWLLMVPTLANAAIGYLVGTSIAVIGLYVSFGIPIYLRWRLGERFERGAWTIGKHYKWICPIGIVWIVLITILFLLPWSDAAMWFTGDFAWTAANYAPLTLGGLLLAAWIAWIVSARKWFIGPIREVDEELAEIERREAGDSSEQWGPDVSP